MVTAVSAAPESSGIILDYSEGIQFSVKVDPVAPGQECSSAVGQVLRAEGLRTKKLLDRISFTLKEWESSGSRSSSAAPLGETPRPRSAGHIASSRTRSAGRSWEPGGPRSSWGEELRDN